jgi:hypothetical protein
MSMGRHIPQNAQVGNVPTLGALRYTLINFLTTDDVLHVGLMRWINEEVTCHRAESFGT